jgi:cytochrome b6-f complex iron-sulfur subunit
MAGAGPPRRTRRAARVFDRDFVKNFLNPGRAAPFFARPAERHGRGLPWRGSGDGGPEMASRYKFSLEEQQRRAAVASELKKKFVAKRAAAETASGGPKKKDAEKKKKVVEAPKIDWAAEKRKRRDRRFFLGGTAAFTAAMGITLAGSNRFSFPRVLFEPPTAFSAGSPDDILVDTPKFDKEHRTWLVKTSGRVYALSGRCTHLGCTPSWLASDGKFKCPCHGSGFRMTGVNFEGPAPRALERFQIRLVSGQLQIEMARMFLFEKGEWENPDSYVII